MSLSFTFFSSLQSVFSMSGAGVLFFFTDMEMLKIPMKTAKIIFNFATNILISPRI